MEESSEIYMKIWNYCKKSVNADFSGIEEVRKERGHG